MRRPSSAINKSRFDTDRNLTDSQTDRQNSYISITRQRADC